MITQIKGKVKQALDKTTVDNKIADGVRYIKKEYKKNLVTALSAALAFVMALYIRDVVKAWIDWVLDIFSIPQGTGLVYQSVIAFVVLTICVLGIIALSKIGSEN